MAERTCPLCGGPARPAFVTRDYNRGATGERFSYDRCDACSSYFLVNVPADLAPFYGGDYFVLPDPARLARLAARESYKLDFLRRHVREGRVVEVGPGFGAFAYLARRAGFAYTGIEMDPRCCEYLRAEVGVEAIESDAPVDALAALPANDAIVLWHALEHLPRPWDLLEQAAARLEPGGILVVAMPNPAAFQFRILRRRWTHVDAPRHLFIIPALALVERARSAGLRLLELTSDDPGGRGWNAFGWQHALMRHSWPTPAKLLAVGAGRAVAAAMSPLERREMRGAAYTAVLGAPAAA